MQDLPGKLRKAEPDDTHAIVALIAQAMNAEEGTFARRALHHHFGCCHAGIDDGRTYLCWMRDEGLSGVTGLHHYHWGPPQNVWLAWFAVRKDLHGRGYGRKLMQATINCAIDREFDKLFVETYDSPDFEKARRFYRKAGFKQCGSIDAYLSSGAAMIVFCLQLRNMPGYDKQ
ncbi:MAG: GNAT family N-acetyltransferase [Chitinivibrionales bacterium]|nr:GNAT family N-acetyltransferase [Chitinivibrionales bacterium]